MTANEKATPTKGDSQQSKDTMYRMWENVDNWFIWQRINTKNLKELKTLNKKTQKFKICEYTLLQRNTNAQKIHERTLNIICHQGNPNQN
jgi:hypothetical protein